LICHAGALGDFILTWPALSGLKRHFNKMIITGIGRLPYMNLAVKYKLIDVSFDFESREMMDFLQGIKMPATLGIPWGAVLWLKECSELIKLLTSTCTQPVVRIDPFSSTGMHLSDYYCSVLKNSFSIPYPENCVDLLPDLRKDWRQNQYVVIHPGSGSMKKNYSLRFYLDLKALLLGYGFKKVLYLLGPAEDRIPQSSFTETEIIRSKDVTDLSDWLSNAALYIGNDSGVSHLAAYLGIPSLVFYRITDPRIWGVRGRRVRYIQTTEEEKARQQVKDFLDKSFWQM